MDWLQFGLFVAAMGGLFYWNRAEANADRRDLANAMLSFKDTVQKEMRDFHGRLCTIEERNKK